MPTTAFNHPAWGIHRQTLRAHEAENYRSWLLDDASLTRRLQNKCGDAFHIKLISQIRKAPQREEMLALGLKLGQCALIRHVYLCCGDKPLVFARTVIPTNTLTGAERRLARLRTRSLGATIFVNPHWKKTARWFTSLAPKNMLFDIACQRLAQKPDIVCGRRTLFHLGDKTLLIGEFFLPSILD